MPILCRFQTDPVSWKHRPGLFLPRRLQALGEFVEDYKLAEIPICLKIVLGSVTQSMITFGTKIITFVSNIKIGSLCRICLRCWPAVADIQGARLLTVAQIHFLTSSWNVLVLFDKSILSTEAALFWKSQSP